jgi:hypothetical protein
MSHIFNLHKNITFRRVQKKENSEIDEQDEDNAVIKKRSSPNPWCLSICERLSRAFFCIT